MTLDLSGDSLVSFFGKEYQIEILHCESAKPYIVISNFALRFLLTTKNFFKQKQEIIYLLKVKSTEFIKNFAIDIANRQDLSFNKIYVKDTVSRWGSCSSIGNININWKLCFAPTKCLEYVIIHELCHIIHMNHSKNFWEEVQKRMPDYKIWHNWLKDNSKLILIKL